jgi:putative salt-induced outer membrane protein YdiY
LEVSADYEHQRTKYFLTQQYRNSNSSSITTKFLQGLTSTESTDYSLWKTTKKIKQAKKPSSLRTSQGTWARSSVEKACAFTEHLAKVFQLHRSENESEEKEALIQLLETPYQLGPSQKS